MSVIGTVSIGMMQADVNAKVDLVVLWIPPTGVDDLVRIGRGIHRPIRDAIVHAIVTIVIDPIAQAVRPVSTCACVTDSGLWWRRARRRRGRTVLASSIPGVGKDNIIVRVVRCGMIEDRFLRGTAWVRRVKKRCDGPLQRERTFHRGAAHAEEETAEQEGCQCVLDWMSHCIR